MTVGWRSGSVPVFSVLRSSNWILGLADNAGISDMFRFEVVDEISPTTPLSSNCCPTHYTEDSLLLLVGRLKSESSPNNGCCTGLFH